MKLADLTKDQLIEKLKATKRRHRKVMKHLERIHRDREARIAELEDIRALGMTVLKLKSTV